MSSLPDVQPIEASSRDGTRLAGYYWPACQTARAAVALVHGLGDHCGRYGEIAQALQRASIACVALDLRGHGRSPGQRGHAASFAQLRQDAETILQQTRELADDRPVVLLGHSMGGTIVLSLALRQRPAVAALVVLSPLILPFQQPARLLWCTGHALAGIFPRFPFRARLPDSVLTHDPQLIEAMGHDKLRHKSISARLAVEMFREGRWLASQGPQVHYPLLLMHGTGDVITSFEATRRFALSIPDGRCTFRAWQGLYHELFNETQRQQVVETIVRFLRDILPAGLSNPESNDAQ